MLKMTIKWNAKLIFLHLLSLPHTELPNTCHKTIALQNQEKRNKNKNTKFIITLEHNKKAINIIINNGY